MGNPFNAISAYPDTERTISGAFTGVSQNLGTALSENPIIAIFDNQSTVPVVVYINGIQWKTFAAGSALVLDMRSNHGEAATYTFALGDQFSIIATGGTGLFSLAILIAR
jgi:hypothetical protein